MFAVPATRELSTTSSRSPVAHDNEIMALAAHSGRLFAATDQWEYSSASASGQVLVKASGHSSWTVFQHTESRRVQALDSFPIPRDEGLGPGHSLLITQAIINGRSQIKWLLDGAKAFTPRDAYALASTGADVRIALAPSTSRSTIVYHEPPVGPFSSGLRGLHRAGGHPQDQARDRDPAGEPLLRFLLRHLPGRGRHPDEARQTDRVHA